MKKILLLLLLSVSITLQSQVQDSLNTQSFIVDANTTYIYKKPKFWDTFRYIPKDYIGFGKYVIQKEHLWQVGLVVGSTAALIPLDKKLMENASSFGEQFGWDKEGKYLYIADTRMFPADASSAVYHIGNGGATLLLSAGFLIYGKIHKDYRALNTSSELAEILISVGLVSQTFKRISGRQSPVRAIESGNDSGHWTSFPSFKAFKENTPNYDAMPSGHLATYVASLFVIATNYPEKKWIKPVGYTLGGLLAFKMVSCKVHWTSDYPLAILVGYAIGKQAANRRIEKKKDIKIGKTTYSYKLHYNLSSMDNNLVGGIRIGF